MRKRTLLISLLTLMVCSFAPAHATLREGLRKQKEVDIWFHYEDNSFELKAVRRKVSATAPARAAIQALLAGPTPDEEKLGFGGLANPKDLVIGTLSVRRGTARVNFVVPPSWIGWPGDIAPARFKEAVKRTLQQFPNVKRVIVSVNGDANFEL
jgi:spore germination protein GerM